MPSKGLFHIIVSIALCGWSADLLAQSDHRNEIGLPCEFSANAVKEGTPNRVDVIETWKDRVQTGTESLDDTMSLLFQGIDRDAATLIRSGSESHFQNGALAFTADSSCVELAPITLSRTVSSLMFGILCDEPLDGQVVLQVRSEETDWQDMPIEGVFAPAKPIKKFQVRLRKLSGSSSAPEIRGFTFTPGDEFPFDVTESEDSLATRAPATRPAGFVSRAGWGARPSKGALPKDKHVAIVLHHTYRPRIADCKGDGATAVKNIQKVHMDDRGWSDIAYHYLIGPTGTYFEGRPEGTLGAHCGANTGRLGVNVIGDFNKGAETMRPAQRKKLLELLTYLCRKYGIATKNVIGHKDVKPTDCPGETFYVQIPSIRQAVAAGLKK